MLSKDSLAYHSGLLPGDIILRVNNIAVLSLNHAVRTIKSITGNVLLTVYRRTLEEQEEES
jgi:C-terminal processing protease CtpA/Prc